MHLDNELRALRPPVGRPSAATVAGHRRALDAAIAEGRTVRRRPGPAGVAGRWRAAAAAVAVVALVGGGLWWAGQGGDERLDTSPAAPPMSGPAADGSDPAAGKSTPITTAPAAGADDPTPTVTFSPDAPVACGPGTPIGDSLPGPLAMLPDETEGALGSSSFDADGRLVARREGGGFTVEAVWPAPDRELYAQSGATASAGTNLGNVSILTGDDEGVDVVVEGTGGQVTVLRILASGSINVTGACRYVQFTVYEQGAVTALFSYDLAADGGQTIAMVNRGPLVVETRQVPEAPAEAVPCNGGPGAPPNDDAAAAGPVAPTPAEALDAYLATPAAATYYQSGYVEMITPDGTYTYGAPIEPGSAEWVTLVTVSPVDGGWAATHVTASGC